MTVYGVHSKMSNSLSFYFIHKKNSCFVVNNPLLKKDLIKIIF